MADLNVITLIGRATKDTELHKTKGGASVATVSLANNRANDTADFFDVVFYDQRAEVAAKYVKKGKQVAISGRLQNRNFEDKNGVKQYRTEIAGYQLQLLGSRGDTPMTQAQALNGGKDFVVDDFDDKEEVDLSSIPFS